MIALDKPPDTKDDIKDKQDNEPEKIHICHPSCLDVPLGELVLCFCGVRRPKIMFEWWHIEAACGECKQLYKEYVKENPEWRFIFPL